MPPENLYNCVALNKPVAPASNNVPTFHPSRKRPAEGTSSSVLPFKKRAAVSSSQIKGSYTSLAERKRRQPTCSIASLRNLEDEETLESDFVGYFGKKSESHYTWGRTEVQSIAATKKRGKAPRFKRGSAADGMFSLFGRKEEGPKIPNSPDRSFFLRFPLEVRERIYGLFLLYPTPILIKHDLGCVERENLRTQPLLRLCQQITKEASNFLYRENVFRAILRNPRVTYHLHESFMIDFKFLSYFRNLVIECQKDNYAMDWYEHASVSMEKLVKAKTVLKSLTFVVHPQRVGLSETACGMVTHPITFADFFWFPGRLMKAFRKIQCTQLNIVVKKTQTIPVPDEPIATTDQAPAVVPAVVASENGTPESGNVPEVIEIRDRTMSKEKVITKRFLISVDLRYLARGAIKEENLRNPETIHLMRANAFGVRKELNRLKARVEDIFLDDKKAVLEGKCRLMEVGEKVTDIIALGGKN